MTVAPSGALFLPALNSTAYEKHAQLRARGEATHEADRKAHVHHDSPACHDGDAEHGPHALHSDSAEQLESEADELEHGAEAFAHALII